MAWFRLSDGVPLWYEDEGSGPAILLVPGWTYTTRFYDRQIADLRRDHRVVALDLRGAGNSGKTPHGHSLSQYAGDVLELIDALDLRDVTVVAWAMAVSVSVHAIIRDPSRIGRLVWTDHSPRFFGTPDWPFGLNGDLDPWRWDGQIRALQDDRPSATRELLESSFHRLPAEAELEWMTAELMKTPTEVMATMLATVANVDLRPLLPALRVPVLAVNGRNSIVPVAVGRWLVEHLPCARQVVVEAGHLPYLEAPEAFNAAVRHFAAEGLSAVPGSAP
jgi:non-heme chloroperoxidase